MVCVYSSQYPPNHFRCWPQVWLYGVQLQQLQHMKSCAAFKNFIPFRMRVMLRKTLRCPGKSPSSAYVRNRNDTTRDWTGPDQYFHLQREYLHPGLKLSWTENKRASPYAAHSLKFPTNAWDTMSCVSHLPSHKSCQHLPIRFLTRSQHPSRGAAGTGSKAHPQPRALTWRPD